MRFINILVVVLMQICCGNAFAAATITTVAGGAIGDGNAATFAAFNNPESIISDGSGNYYIADTGNHRIRKISAGGVVSTFAGTGQSGFAGDGGPAVAAKLYRPRALVFDLSGNLLVSDSGNNRIRRISSGGIITTVAGTGDAGFSGDGGPAVNARIKQPSGLYVESDGTLLFSDSANNRVRGISPSGTITTVAGDGVARFAGDGGAAEFASLNSPAALVVAKGYLLVADSGNDRVRKIDRYHGGNISTFAGGGTGDADLSDVPAAQSHIFRPEGLAVNYSGNVFISSKSDNRIYRVDSSSEMIRTIVGAGTVGLGTYGGDGGSAALARLNGPLGLHVDWSDGSLFLADTFNHRIRKISADGIITTIAGIGFFGNNGPAISADIHGPTGVAFDAAGNMYIAERTANRVRKVSTAGVISVVAGNGSAGYSGDGGLATNAALHGPRSVALDGYGNLFIADRMNHRIRMVNSSGIITTVAGNGIEGFGGDGGAATDASLRRPFGIAVDLSGDLYIADTSNGRIRKVSGGLISTVAGGGNSVGNGGSATKEFLAAPYAVAVDSSGKVYIADSGNNRVRLVVGGIITTIAGDGVAGFYGDGGPAIAAALSFPTGLAIDAQGGLFIADLDNNRIRYLSATGIIKSVAGSGVAGFNGDGELSTLASLDGPIGVASDASGAVFIADTSNNRIRSVRASSVVPPGAPTSVVATAGNAKASITFSAPTSNGGGAITGYAVTSVPAGGIDGASGSTNMSRVITGLNNGVSYTFTVTATNAAGTGSPSVPSNAVVPFASVLSVNDLDVNEGSDGVWIAHGVINLSASLSEPVVFDLTSADGTANSIDDYVPLRLIDQVIPAGQTSYSFSLAINGDMVPEDNETIKLSLANVRGAGVGKFEATIRILNDDIDPATAIKALDDHYALAAGKPTIISADIGVLANDRNLSDLVSIFTETLPKNGALRFEDTGGFAYTPNNGFQGSDSFKYGVCSRNGPCESATVDLSVVQPLSGTDQYLWLVPPGSNTLQEGLVRIANREQRPGNVSIWGIDATGRRSSGTATLSLSSLQAVPLTSLDLENGNAGKGLIGSLGKGEGNWMLVVRSDIDVDALAYIRTPDGFLAPVHDRVEGDGTDWVVAIFNPAENTTKVSWLRVINTSLSPVSIQISGIDDDGAAATGTVTATLPPLASREYSAIDLEGGNAGKGLIGKLGDGKGKWRLSVSATGRISLQSLLSDANGYLTNLSTFTSSDVLLPGQPALPSVLWMVTRAANDLQEGFIRVTNLDSYASNAMVWGIDDHGERSPGIAFLDFAAGESKQLTIKDLEFGNPARGLTGSIGSGSGDWRIAMATDLDLVTVGMIRSRSGFLTTLHDTVLDLGRHWRVPMFNPASNTLRTSVLRVINLSGSVTTVSVAGVDDAGRPSPMGAVTFTLEPSAAVEFTSAELENGSVERGLVGRLGDGSGKWVLNVQADDDIKVISLLRDPNGNMTNLSNETHGTSAQLDP